MESTNMTNTITIEKLDDGTLGFVVPEPIVNQLGIQEGDNVTFNTTNGGLITLHINGKGNLLLNKVVLTDETNSQNNK